MKTRFILGLLLTGVGFMGCKPVGEVLSDFLPPSSSSISINGGASVTNSTSATLTLSSSGAVDMYITNTAGCASGGAWQAYSTSKTWTLSPASGTATVYVKFRDRIGNETTCSSDSIAYDGTAPSFSSVSVSPSSPSNDTTPTATFTLSEAATVTLYNGSACTSALSAAASKASGAQTLDTNALSTNQTYAIYAKAVDAASNSSSCTLIGNYTFDNTAPTGVSLSFASVTGTTLTVNWIAATDAVTSQANLQYKLVKASSSAAIDTVAEVDAIPAGADLLLDYTANTITKAVTGLSSETTYYFAVVVKDAAGNKAVFGPSSQATTDVTAPTVGVISFSSVTGTSMNVDWTAATDTATAQASLQYKLVKAASTAAIDTVEEVDAIPAGADLLLDYTANTLTKAVTGLTLETDYAFAVVVKDAAGNKALYTPKVQRTDQTNPVVDSPTDDISFSTNLGTSVQVNWGAADDGAGTPGAQLQYKLVRASSSAAIDSVAEVDAITTAGAGLVMDWTANTLTSTAAGLTSETVYWFTVVVKDTVGNKSLYTPQSVTTADITPPTAGTLAITGTTGGANYTSNQFVDLAISGVSGATQMCVTNDSADPCDGASPGASDPAWEAFDAASATLTGWQINQTSNVETVYVKYKDAAGNTSQASQTIRRVPEVLKVTASSANGLYVQGQTITVQVVFNTGVAVTGAPYITLATGYSSSNNNRASCSTTTSTTTLADDTVSCTYTVGSGHNSTDLDYASTSALALNGGTIDINGGTTDALLTLPDLASANSLAGQKALVVDTAPIVVSVSANKEDGTYGASASIPVEVTFSEPVTVTGNPQLTLETGVNDAVVDFTSVSSSVATFNYTVAAGHHSGDLDYVATSSLTLPTGAAIRDQDGSAANAILTLPNPGTAGSLGANKALIIDTPAQVTGVVSTTGNGPFRKGNSVSVSVSFTAPVTVVTSGGTPYLELQTNSTPLGKANYASGSTTNTLVFTYSVALGQASSDLDYVATDSLKLNGGTIKNGTQDANLTLVAPGAVGSISDNEQVVVDPFPEVSSVTSSSSNGLYDVGGTVSIQVEFTEEVTVTGSPELELNTSASGMDAKATCSAVSGSTTMNCSYTVAYGETSIGPNDDLRGQLEYTSTSALSLNGGTIVDANETSGNADLTLPSPGASGSLASNKILRTLLGKAVAGGAADLGFGSAVAGAGDLDGNFRPEVIISAPLKDDAGTDRGEVYVLTDTGALLYTRTGSEDNAGFGKAVAGGFNVDGAAEKDYLVGAPQADGAGTDRGQVFVYEGATTVLRTLTGAADGDEFGTSVALLGDLNGDLKSEIAVGAPGANAGGTDRGAVYIYDGDTGAELVVLNGVEDNARFGAAIANAGDVDGDGLNDLVIGAPNETFNGAESGRVYVYRSTFNSSVVGLSYYWDVAGEAAGDHLGTSVAKVGLVNADAFSDILVGAPDHASSKGRAYVLNGSSGAALHTVTGDTAGDKLGYSVAGLGDRTSDSKAEFIVGAPFAAGGGTARGIAKVFNGDTGAVIYTLTGANDNEHFGEVVAEVEGNIDGDGHNDFIVAAPDFNTDEGRGHYYR